MTYFKVWIKNIQNKTEKQKKVLAFIVSLSITAVIVFVWMLNLITLGPSSNKIVKINSSSTNEATITQSVKKFFKSLTNFGKEEYYSE